MVTICSRRNSADDAASHLTGEEPEERPEARLVALEDEQQDVSGRDLEELVEGVH
jgi:hypothetical protein